MVTQAVRRARWAVFALFFTNGALYANVVPRYPQIKDMFALSDPVYGMTVALFPLGAMVFGPFSASVIRRFTSAKAAAWGTVAVGAMLVLAGVCAGLRVGAHAGTVLAVATYVGFAAFFFLAGGADSITDVGQNAHGLRVQRYYSRSIFTTYHGGWSLGAVLGGVMGSVATALNVPLFAHLIGAALIFMMVGLVALHFTLPGPDQERPSQSPPNQARPDQTSPNQARPDPAYSDPADPRSEDARRHHPDQRRSIAAGGADEPAGHVNAGSSANPAEASTIQGSGVNADADNAAGGVTARSVHTRPWPLGLVLLLLVGMMIGGMGVEDVGSTWSALYLRDFVKVAASTAGMGYVVLLLAQAVARFSADRVIDALGSRLTVLGSGVLVIAGGLLTFTIPHLWATVVGLALAGAGSAAIVPTAMNAADDIPGLKAGTALTIVGWLGRLAFLVAPPLVGLLVQSTSLRWAIVLIPIYGGMVLVTSLVLAGSSHRTVQGAQKEAR